MEAVDKGLDVSIVVPVYNHEKYVRQALSSIINQETVYSYEILIGDDASSDHSQEIIKEFEREYPKRVRAFYRNKNIGATKNGYELFMETKGKYVVVLEGDDYWIDKDKIQKQITFLEKHMEYIGVACNFCKVDRDGKILEESCISNEWVNREFTWKDFLERGFEFQTATFIYRNIFRDGKDYSILYKAHELVGDLTILTILLNQKNIYIMKDVMSAYRYVSDKSASNACSISKRDPALSELKTVRQYIMLRPFLKNSKDFDFPIAMKKTDFLIQMIKHKEGYTWKRWMEMEKLGGLSTNLSIIPIFLNLCLKKIFLEHKVVCKCKKKRIVY